MLYLQLDFLTQDEFSLSLSLKVIFCSCAENWISWNCNWSVLRNIFQITPINFSSSIFLVNSTSIFFFFFKTSHLMSLIIFFHPFVFVMKFDFHDISTETQMNEKKFWNEIAATCYELIRTSTSWLSHSPTSFSFSFNIQRVKSQKWDENYLMVIKKGRNVREAAAAMRNEVDENPFNLLAKKHPREWWWWWWRILCVSD